jgi:hypothetical protein
MAFQPVQFEFPDPEKAALADKGVKETDNGNFEITIEGRDSEKPEPKDEPKAKKSKEEDLDIEVVDDRPEQDREKRKSKAPMELTDEEMQDYSERVRKRLQHFSKGYHDQRRAAEDAAREREEALRLAQQLAEENKKLKGTVSKNQEVLLEQAKKEVARDLALAKTKYKRAYEAGDADKLVAAQEELTTAKLRADRVDSIRPTPLQESETEVQPESFAPAPSVDRRAADWQKANKWFGEDDEMTSFALGLHQKLVKQGVDPRSDDYYEKINSRMRQVFPDTFADEADDEDEHEPEVEERRRKTNVVAPATRSVAPKKITLTRTQVALAKKLGLPLEIYAKQVAEEMRKQNG